MATAEQTLVRDVMEQPSNVINADETLDVANRVMSGQTVRSLIVVEQNQLVGVVFITDVREAEHEGTVRDVMHTDFPTVRADATVGEARAALGEFDYDLLPVVDEQGLLIGEVPRPTVVHSDHEVTTSRDDTNLDLPQRDGTTKPVTIRSGMAVTGASGHKLGTVDEITLADGTPTTFTVKHGLAGRKHKQLSIDLIDRVDDDVVVLKIDTTEFKFLADIEDEE